MSAYLKGTKLFAMPWAHVQNPLRLHAPTSSEFRCKLAPDQLPKFFVSWSGNSFLQVPASDMFNFESSLHQLPRHPLAANPQHQEGRTDEVVFELHPRGDLRFRPLKGDGDGNSPSYYGAVRT